MTKQDLTKIWETMFDRVYCIHYLPYTNRIRPMEHELDRVGLLAAKNFEIHQTFPNPFDRLILNSGKTDLKKQSVVNISLAHYACAKKAAVQGCKRVAILEDDEFFMNDITELGSALSDIPLASVVWCDWNLSRDKNKAQRSYSEISAKKINAHFADVGNHHLMNAGFYVLTGGGIEHLIENQERRLSTPENYNYHRDSVPDRRIRRCISLKPLAIQRIYSNSQTYKAYGRDRILERYEFVGVSGEDYSYPCE